MKVVECKEFPGFYEIEGFPDYCIAKDSRILKKSKNKIIKQHKSYGSGSSKKETGYYLSVLMYDKDENLRGRFVHRIMGLVFKRPEGDISLLHVHHINGVKHNNTLDNLEWTTCKDNLKLAREYYGPSKKIPCQVKHGLTGIVTTFNSVKSAARFLGVHRTTAIYRMEKGRTGHVYPDGYALRYGSGDEEWKLEDRIEEITPESKSMLLVKNLCTGVVTEAPTLEAVRELVPLMASTLCVIVNNPAQPSCWGKNGHVYLIIKKYPQKEFRRVKDPYEDLSNQRKNRRVVYAVNVVTNEKRIYEAVQHCADDFGLRDNTLSARLNKKIPRAYNNWIFRYY